MTHDEQQRMYVACCLACLLAEKMKTCHLCRFNIGLQYKKAEVKPSQVDTVSTENPKVNHMLKVIYNPFNVSIQKNVNPFNEGLPMWEDIGIYDSLESIPKDIISQLSEDDITSIAWFFFDLEIEQDADFSPDNL